MSLTKDWISFNSYGVPNCGTVGLLLPFTLFYSSYCTCILMQITKKNI